MGYLFAIIGVLVLLAVLFLVFNSSRRASTKGTLESDHPVTRTQPAADAPTPGASMTASRDEARQADQHTPPS